MSEITEFLLYTCNINRKTETWTDEYWVPIKTDTTANRKCFIDSPKWDLSFNDTDLKIDAILFLEDLKDIKEWDEVTDIYKDDILVDWKKYKVVWVEPLFDDDWLHHVEINLQILW